MKVFLLRHAASVDAENSWPTPKSPLSNLGRKQAQVLSRLPRFQMVDLILASRWIRAKETAEIISKAINKPLKLFEEIHEREQHSKIYGAKRSSQIGRRYYEEAIANYRNIDWKFEGLEESLREVAERATQFKDRLVKDYLGHNLLVVSHDMFIRCFITVCILGKDYKDGIFNKIFRSLQIVNTGISLLEYEERRKIWRVWYLNDFSHLKYVKNENKP